MIGLIMAGGSGTRFWPLSRKKMAKQYLSIFNEKSLIQLTFERLNQLIKAEDIYVITTIDQHRIVHEHLPQLPKKNIIIEPYAMNTAACIAYSVNYLNRFYSDSTDLLIVPSDQLIDDYKLFNSSVISALELSQKGFHVVFGIKPSYPATGYGYIEQGQAINPSMFHVKQFKEKPDQKTAEMFISSGSFHWNCGIFLWTLKTINSSFRKYYAEGSQILDQINLFNYQTENFFKIRSLYKSLPKMPVDIAIMEKAEQRAVVPLNLKWSDVGSWYSLHEVLDKDMDNNHFSSNSISINSHNNLVISKKLITCVDVDNLVIVETDDSILILPRGSSEKVKLLVEKMKADKLTQYL